MFVQRETEKTKDKLRKKKTKTTELQIYSLPVKMKKKPQENMVETHKRMKDTDKFTTINHLEKEVQWDRGKGNTVTGKLSVWSAEEKKCI